MGSDDIVVIGAGPAGLATSACLRQLALRHVVLEREAQVASSWRGHYDRLHLHTSQRHSSLPMTPWPSDAPRYPSRVQMVDYLSHYAREHAVMPRFGVDVRSVTRRGDRFLLDTSCGTLSPRRVVMATGANAIPRRPEFPGLDQFRGLVVHAQDYRNPTPCTGLRTLVVGCGNSGAEIALDLAMNGVEVAMVVRGPVHVVPRDLLGRPSQEAALLLSVLPRGLRDALSTAVMRVAVGDLTRWGIVRPRVGVNRFLEDAGRVPMLDVGTVAAIKAGRIGVRPAIAQVLADQVRFTDGVSLPFEALILATGYRSGLSRLLKDIDTASDATEQVGLFLVGFKTSLTGALREIALEAARVAATIKSQTGR